MTRVDLAALILRLALGGMICMHGYAHVWRGGKIAGTARWFKSIGMRPPLVQAWMASITEMGSGALLILGLVTPLAAAGLIGVMTVAFVVEHRTKGFFIYNPGQGWEYVAVIAAAGLALGTLGGGRFSLDRAFDIDITRKWGGLLICIIAGFGGAALQLAASWRPVKKGA